MSIHHWVWTLGAALNTLVLDTFKWDDTLLVESIVSPYSYTYLSYINTGANY